MKYEDMDKYENKLPYDSWKTEVGQLYREENKRLDKLFQEDLFNDLGIENNPKRFRLFELAWDRGHSSGYYSVYNEACELVSLIED